MCFLCTGKLTPEYSKKSTPGHDLDALTNNNDKPTPISATKLCRRHYATQTLSTFDVPPRILLNKDNFLRTLLDHIEVNSKL